MRVMLYENKDGGTDAYDVCLYCGYEFHICIPSFTTGPKTRNSSYLGIGFPEHINFCPSCGKERPDEDGTSNN